MTGVAQVFGCYSATGRQKLCLPTPSIPNDCSLGRNNVPSEFVVVVAVGGRCRSYLSRPLFRRANNLLITFRVSRRRREMYCGHARLCVCLSAAACPHHCTDPDVTWESGRGCPLVVHYWADLQSVHELRSYGNITRTRNVSDRWAHACTRSMPG